MKELTRQEFQERLMDLHRARKIFIEPGLTDNISTAFEVYQEVLAAKRKVDRLNTRDHQSVTALLFGRYPRPKCPACGSPLRFREVPKNQEGFQSQLVCLVVHKGAVLNSPLSLAEWQGLLTPENMGEVQKMVDGLPRVDRSAPLPGKMEGQEPETCPECGFKTLYKIKACCGAPNGYLWCDRCQFEKIL